MLPFRQSYSRVFHKNQENLQVSRVVKGPGHMLCYKGQLCLYHVPCISAETNAQDGVCHGARFTVHRVVQYPQGCDTYIKYNDELSKTGVSKLHLWGLGMQQHSLNVVLFSFCSSCTQSKCSAVYFEFHFWPCK